MKTKVLKYQALVDSITSFEETRDSKGEHTFAVTVGGGCVVGARAFLLIALCELDGSRQVRQSIGVCYAYLVPVVECGAGCLTCVWTSSAGTRVLPSAAIAG